MIRLLLTLCFALLPLCGAVPAQVDALLPGSSGPVLRLDGIDVPADEYGRWLLTNFGERSARAYAHDYHAVDREARRLGIEVAPDEIGRRVSADIEERIEKAFFGRKSGWIEELTRTSHTEAGVRRQRETELLPMVQAEKMAAIGRVVPEEKIVRDWEQRYGRKGRDYDLLMTKVLVEVPSEEGQDRARWLANRQRVMDEGLAKARAIRARIAGGEDFGKVARETSDDPDTRDRRGQPARRFDHYAWPANFQDALDRLAPGDLSEPLFANGGWWVVKALAVRTTPLASVRDAIRKELEEKGPEQDEVGAVLERLNESTHFRILPAMFAGPHEKEHAGAADPVLDVDGESVTRAQFARWLLYIQGETLARRYAEDWILEREAQRLGITVTDEEVTARAREWLEHRINEGYKGSREAWSAFLKMYGRTEESYLFSQAARCRTDLLAEKMLLRDRKVTDADVASAYAREFGEKGERLAVRWLVLVIEGDEPPADATREQLDALMKSASERTHARAVELVQRMRGGADFAQLAREHSDDAATRANGGLRPRRFRADPFPDTFGPLVTALAVGEVTDPLLLGNRWVVFQMAERRKMSLDEAKPEIREDLMTKRPSEMQVGAYRNLKVKKVEIEILPGMSG